MTHVISLENLLGNMFHKGKPLLTPDEKEFIELCVFAEETGWKKIKEDRKSVTYQNDYIGKKAKLPKPY